MIPTPREWALQRAQEEWHRWATLNRAERAMAVLEYILVGCHNPRPKKGYLWCGAFAAWCWVGIHPELRKRLFPSTYRLRLLGHYSQDKNLWPNTHVELPDGEALPIREWHRREGEERLVQHPAKAGKLSWDPRPGDIATVRHWEKHDCGAHVVLIVREDAGTLTTLSGNSSGLQGNGQRGYGVCQVPYQAEQLQMVVRLSPLDLRQDVNYRRAP